LHKILKSKRGISPILATLLLIVIAVAAIVVTYAWVITFTGSTTNQAGVILNKENTYWNSTGSKTVVIYVKNQGTSDAEINAVYIGTSSTNLLLQSSVSYYPSSKLVYANGVNTQVITVTYNWNTDTQYYFKVAPKVGAALEFNVRSPQS
jgi:flagellin-like protein